MVRIKCICMLIAILLAIVQQSTAAVSDTDCTTNGNTDCTVDHSVCVSGNCKCSDGYKEDINDGSTCVDNVITENECTPGDDDNGNTKCQGADPNAVCPESTTNCACKADYFLNSDSTLCIQKITTVGCTPGVAGTTACKEVDANSECKTGDDKCSCRAGYKGTDSCTIDAVTEITCDAGDKDCTFEHSECDDADTSPKCICSDGYKKDSTDGSTCVKIIGGTCGDNDDCTGTVINSVCTAGKCECNENYIEESAVCKKALGQTCTDQDTCVSNAECDEECTCSSGFTNSNGFCAAESSATSVWMASSLLVTALLIHLPRFILW